MPAIAPPPRVLGQLSPPLDCRGTIMEFIGAYVESIVSIEDLRSMVLGSARGLSHGIGIELFWQSFML
jgi:hypothetical protein